ncbi:MAG: hypothetical protein ACKVU1_07540 [bacterium]
MTNRRIFRGVRGAILAAACVCVCGLVQSERCVAQTEERLLVSPAEAVVAPGGTLRFTVEVDGAAKGEPVEWRVIPGTLGAIAPDGVFLAAPRAGRGIVRAETRSGGVVRVGHALLRVSETPGAARLRITPASATLAPGDAIVFRAEPEASGALEAPVEWSVAPEDAGTITADGRFVAGPGAGRSRVLAQTALGGANIEGAARVWIGATRGAAPSLAITPTVLTLRPGERSRLDARIAPPGADSLLSRIRWSVFPSTLGWLAPDGTFEAGASAGEGHAAASIEWDGEAVRAFARIRVFPEGGESALRVRPASALLVVGRPVRFEAVLLARGGPGGGPGGGIDAGNGGGNRPSGGDRERERIQAEWSVEPASLGTITPDGVLTPAGDSNSGGEWDRTGGAAANSGDGPASGFVVARAIVDGIALEARAAVRLAPGAVSDLLELRPRAITTRPGGETRVDAFLGGRPLPAIVPIRWSVAPTTLGTVTPDGLFTANATLANPASDDFGRREGVLIATAALPEGKLATGTARVVIVPDARPEGVRVVPPQATIGLAETVRFRVAAVGGGAEHIAEGGVAGSGTAGAADLAEPRVVWRVVPDRLGTITPDGLFTPNPRLPFLAGSESAPRFEGRVLAEVRVSPSEVVRGEARVTILLPAAGSQLSIEPPSADLAAAATIRFAATLDGSDASGLPLASWSVVPRALGTITADGLFTPNPEPPLVGGPIRRGQVRFSVRLGAFPLEASADVTVRY